VSSSSAQQQQLEQHASVAVFTCGEVALLRACPVPGGLSVLLQALTAEHLLPAAGAADAQQDIAMDEEGSSQEAVAAGGAGEDSSGRRVVPMGLQAHTWVAFGKLCLVDEGLAKKCVPLFVQVRDCKNSSSSGEQLQGPGGVECSDCSSCLSKSRPSICSRICRQLWVRSCSLPLTGLVYHHPGAETLCHLGCCLGRGTHALLQALGASPHPVVRNNIMVALSDMVIQFTALVDSHMPRLAACIRWAPGS
jgi:hypothetical protein